MARKKVSAEEKAEAEEKRTLINRIQDMVSIIPEFEYLHEREKFVDSIVLNLFRKYTIQELTIDELEVLLNFACYYVPIIDWKLCKIKELQDMFNSLKEVMGNTRCRCNNYGF